MTIDSASGEQEQTSTEQPLQPSKPIRNDQNAMFLRSSRAGNLEHVLDFLRTGVDINTCNSNGLNALHLASKEGHNEVVRELLRRGAFVDASTRKGNTALHIASLAGQDIIVTILVEHGANVNAQSLNGFTPLYMSAQENHEVVVRYLLAHGANQALATEDGFTPLAVALQQGHDRIVALLLENDNTSKVKLPALHIAAKKDDTRAASLLLQNEQNPNVTSKSGFTPLHIAAHYGNADIAQLLIEKGANVNFQARHNISPLHVSAKWGRVKLCELVLDKGAIIDCRTRDLLTPLHCAARSGHDSVVEILIERGAPIAAKTKNGLAPLHMAAQGDHFDCARILLYHKANVDEVTVDYLTPLHVAAHCGHVNVAKLLLDRQADPNARALNGFTPLHIACKKNRIKVVELLLKYHASVGATTESGLSPLHVASFMGCINIVIFLIQQGANVDCETVRGETPLHLAARANQTDIVRVLVRNKANVDAQARELQTPLHIAARLGNSDIALILLNAHANPNSATKDQYTPLHIAAKEGQEEVVQLLLDKKSNKQLLTKKGFSPLHLAAKYGNYGVVKLLLEKGTPIDIEGKNQVTPLHVASHYNNEKVAQLLLEHGARAQACAKNGYTPLHIAAKKNQMEIAQSLLAYRADPNAESRAGFTPLHLASDEGHIQMVAVLVEKGSQVNAKAKNGLTPMHLCAQEDRVNVAEQLYQCEADVNAKTNAGYTPLHVACHFGQMEMVKWLVEHGAIIDAETKTNYTALHQAAQQGHNHVVRYLLENGASPNIKTSSGQTPLSIAQRLGYVSVVETLKTVTETTIITETTTITDERYKPQNPEAMNETIFSDSEEEADDHQVAAAEHARDFNESITQGLRDSAVVHLIHTGEQQLSKSTSPFDTSDADLEAIIKRAQNVPISTAFPDPSFLENGHDDNIAFNRNELIQPSKLFMKTFLISFMVDARGGAMRGCRHSGVRVIIPPRKAEAPIRITCRYLKKEKLATPLRLSEGEALASRILEMGPAGAKFLGPVILEVPHFASLRGREREIVILRSDDGKFWKEHQLEATEDAVQEVLNESFDAQELQQLDELHTSRITRILTNDFPMYFAVVTRVRQEVHCVGPEGGVILSSVVPHVQAIFPDGSLTKTIKVSLQAQPVPQELVTKLHGNRVAVSPIVTVEPRRRKFHKPITLCIPLPQSTNKGMITQYQQQEKLGKDQKDQPQHEPPTLRLLCSITGGIFPAQWEDITGTTQLTFAGDEISFTTTVSARFWLMDCQTPRDAAKMAQEIYNESISIPFMARFVVFARRSFPTEGQLRMFCMTDDKEEKTLEKQEGFQRIAVSKDVEVLEGKHQWLEFAGNLTPVTKKEDQLAIFFQPFQENRLAFNIKVRQKDDQEAASSGKVAVMKEPIDRTGTLPPQHHICLLSITLPDYTGPLPSLLLSEQKGGGGDDDYSFKKQQLPLTKRYSDALNVNVAETYPNIPIEFVSKTIGADWARLGRVLGIHPDDIRQIRREIPSGSGQEPLHMLKIWVFLKGTSANESDLRQALRQIGRDDICVRMTDSDNNLMAAADSDINISSGTPINLKKDFTSKTSLATSSKSLTQQPEATIKISEEIITPTVEIASKPFIASQPVTTTTTLISPEQQIDVETVVTRTERHVHHSEDINEPVVDERVTTQIFRDGQQMEQLEKQKLGQPLNEQEQTQWEEMAEAKINAGPENEENVHDESMDYLERSRKAMVVDGGEQYLMEYDKEGNPIGQTTFQTTTLITTEHLRGHPPINIEQKESKEFQSSSSPVEEEEEESEPLIEEVVEEDEEEKKSFNEGIQSQPSSEGSSVVIHEEKPQETEDPFKIYEEEQINFQKEKEEVPLTEIEKSSTFEEKEENKIKEQQQKQQTSDLGISTYDNVNREKSNGYEDNEEEKLKRESSSHEGANKIEPVKNVETTQEDEKKEEEWAKRENPEIQQFEQVQESFPIDDSTMVTKKRTHIISTSQSRVKGLDEFTAAASSAGAISVFSGQLSPTDQQYIRDEESPPPPESLSISITSQSDSLMTTSSISVKDKIAQFELLKKVEEIDDSIDGTKKRFGWHPQPKKIEKEKSEEIKSPRDDQQRQPSPVGSDVPGAFKSKIPKITSPTRLTPSPTVSPRKQEEKEEKIKEIENNFLLKKFEEKGEANYLKKEYLKITEYLFFEIKKEEEPIKENQSQIYHSIITEEPFYVEKAFSSEIEKKEDLISKDNDNFDEKIKEIPKEIEKVEEYLIKNELKEKEEKEIAKEEEFEILQIPKEEEEEEFIKMESNSKEEKEKEELIVINEQSIIKSKEINSTVWLNQVPKESFVNENQVFEERKELLWPKEEEKEEEIIETKPWWKKINKLDEDKLKEVNNKNEKQKIIIEDKDERKKLIEEEKDEEENDEQSSTHTVILRPEVLIEEAVDITPIMDRALSLQGEEGIQTPTMSAARWKSLDERYSPSSLSSPIHSYPSPSPIIEITPPPVEEEYEIIEKFKEEEELIKEEMNFNNSEVPFEKNNSEEGELEENKEFEEQENLIMEDKLSSEKIAKEEKTKEESSIILEEKELNEFKEEEMKQSFKIEEEKTFEKFEKRIGQKEETSHEIKIKEKLPEEIEERIVKEIEQKEEFYEDKTPEEYKKLIFEEKEREEEVRKEEEELEKQIVVKEQKELSEIVIEEKEEKIGQKEERNELYEIKMETPESEEKILDLEEKRELSQIVGLEEKEFPNDDYEMEKSEIEIERKLSEEFEGTIVDRERKEEEQKIFKEGKIIEKKMSEEFEGTISEEEITKDELKEKFKEEEKTIEENEEEKQLNITAVIGEKTNEELKEKEETSEEEYKIVEKDLEEFEEKIEEEKIKKRLSLEEEKSEEEKFMKEEKLTDKEGNLIIKEKMSEEKINIEEMSDKIINAEESVIIKEKDYKDIEDKEVEQIKEYKEEEVPSVKFKEMTKIDEHNKEKILFSEEIKEISDEIEDKDSSSNEEFVEKEEYLVSSFDDKEKEDENKTFEEELINIEDNNSSKKVIENVPEELKDEFNIIIDEKTFEEEKEENIYERDLEQEKCNEERTSEEFEKIIVNNEEINKKISEEEILKEDKEEILEKEDEEHQKEVDSEIKSNDLTEQKQLSSPTEQITEKMFYEEDKIKEKKEYIIEDKESEFEEEKQKQEENIQYDNKRKEMPSPSILVENVDEGKINEEEPFMKEKEIEQIDNQKMFYNYKDDNNEDIKELSEEKKEKEEEIFKEEYNEHHDIQLKEEEEEEQDNAEILIEEEKVEEENDEIINVNEEIKVKMKEDEEIDEKNKFGDEDLTEEEYFTMKGKEDESEERDEWKKLMEEVDDEREKLTQTIEGSVKEEQNNISNYEELEMIKQAEELVDDAIKKAFEDSLILHHDNYIVEDKEQKEEEREIFVKGEEEINISEFKKSSGSEEEDEEISFLTIEEEEKCGNEGEAKDSPELYYGDGDEEFSEEQSQQQSPSELFKNNEIERKQEDNNNNYLNPSSSSLLLPSGTPRRPKSPLPPPIAATPPQTGKVVDNLEKEEQKEDLEDEEEKQIEEVRQEKDEEESMLLSDVKMPVDDLLVLSTHKEGEDDEDNNYFISSLSIPEKHDNIIGSSDLMIVHSKSLEEVKLHEKEEKTFDDDNWHSSFGKKEMNVEITEGPIEEPQHRIGGSLEASPAEKRRRRSSNTSAHGSTNGSLSEFERIEQEIIEGREGKILISSSPHHSPEAGKIIKKQQHSPTKGEGINTRGSNDSLNEFEQLERGIIHEGITCEDIMMLSDIREEEGDEEGESYEISGEEEEEEERDYLGKELKKENNNNELMMISSGYDSSAQQIDIIAQQQSPEISEKLLENLSKEEKIIESKITEELKKEEKEIKKQNIPSSSSLEKKDFIFGGGGVGGDNNNIVSSSVGVNEEEDDDDNSEKTIFETVSVNSIDGSEERIVRTAITKVRNPIYSRVRFAGTEDEQQIKAILESGRINELELKDNEGNITLLKTIVQRGNK